MITENFALPSHWAPYFVNGDVDGYDCEDMEAIHAFEDSMLSKYGRCWCVGVGDEVSFMKYHDATNYGALACDTLLFTFDVGGEK